MFQVELNVASGPGGGTVAAEKLEPLVVTQSIPSSTGYDEEIVV